MEDLDLLLQDLESLGMKSCLRQGVDYGWGIDLKGECDGKLDMHLTREAFEWLHEHCHLGVVESFVLGQSSWVLPQKFNDVLQGDQVVFSLHGQIHLFEFKVQDPPASLTTGSKELYQAETRVLYIVKAVVEGWSSIDHLPSNHEILFPLTENHRESQNLQLRLAQKLRSLTH